MNSYQGYSRGVVGAIVAIVGANVAAGGAMAASNDIVISNPTEMVFVLVLSAGLVITGGLLQLSTVVKSVESPWRR
jgi:predicted acyltransferase (DUF342 family)